MNGVKGPLNSLPISHEEILKDVDYYLVTHNHPDHFTPDYLPKSVKILVANELDRNDIKALGFNNVSVIEKDDDLVDIKIQKTPGTHGDNEKVALTMGASGGYILTGEKKSLYFAGDTVFNFDISNILKKFKPDVIILNSDAATMPEGRLIMDLNDVLEIHKICPESTIILTHFDSINHGLISSEEAKEFVKEHNLKNVLIPKNGEWISL